jgi:hypothetical protein
MAESKLKTGKNIILPKLDNIQDVETRRVLQELFRALQDINFNNYSDHAHLDERLKDVEP